MSEHDHDKAVRVLRDRLQNHAPQLALVLGSGLGQLAESIQDALVVSYAELPGFPQSTVHGHAGQLVIGTLQGVAVACMQGRMHYYEGHRPAQLAVPIRTLKAIGCNTLFLTNAAGSLRAEMGPGSLMMLTDHINWADVNPLIGPNDENIGPRFFDLSRAYHPDLLALLRQAAADAGIELCEGVYLMCSGPNFETPAEIRAFRVLGADAVGMSTVPECLVANHCGMRVAAVSTITNLAAGMTAHALSHEETLAEGAAAAVKLAQLLKAFLRRFAGAVK